MPSPWLQSVPDRLLYPPLAGHITTNVVIIGGGLLGVFTAWQLAKDGHSVVLLDKKHLGTGATGSSLGIISRMPNISAVGISEKYGFDLGARFYSAYSLAEKELLEWLETENIDCDLTKRNSYLGSFTKNDQETKRQWKILERMGSRVSWVDEATAKINALPFGVAVRFVEEGACNPRAFLYLLLAKINKDKLRVYEESEVMDIEIGDKITIATTGGSIVASQIVLATETPPSFFRELDDLARPIQMRYLSLSFDKLPLSQGIFWGIGEPYLCFRNIDDHTVALEMEKIGRRDIARQKLDDMLKDIFHRPFTIEDSWSGGILQTQDGLPYVFDHPHYRGKVFVALGFARNGIVGAFLASQVLRALVTKAYHPAKNILDLYRTGTRLPVPRIVRKKAISLPVVAEETAERPNSKLILAERIKRRLIRKKWVIIFALVEVAIIGLYLGWVYWSGR